MTRAAFVVVLAACLALVATPAAAQDNLSKRVTLDLKAMAPADAFKVIADSVGMKVSVDAKVTTPVDILVRDVTAKTALTTICESIGCRWTVSNNVISVALRSDVSMSGRVNAGDAKAEKAREATSRIKAALKQTLPAGMTFDNAPLSEVNARLSAALGLTIKLASTDPNLRTLTADFSNQTLLDAFKTAITPGDHAHTWRIFISDGGKAPMFGFTLGKKK